MAKVGYFEIQVDDFKRARKFYREVFGWNFSKIDSPVEYYMIDTGHKGEDCINGGMVMRQQSTSEIRGVSGYVCAIYVPSIDDALEKVRKNRGRVTMGKTELPGMGYVAYGLDSENNAFSLWQTEE